MAAFSEDEDKLPGEMTVCIRIIRSFEYRSIKTIVLRKLPPIMLVRDLMQRIDEEIQANTSLPPPFRKLKYDTLKIHSYAHGAKTNDTAINLDKEEWILDPNKSLAESQIYNETELSYFKREDYNRYKENPQMLW